MPSRNVPDFSAARLREHRIQRGLTQAQLAEAAGVPRQMITRLENASGAGPSRTTLTKIAAVLGIRPAELLDLTSSGADTPVPGLADLRALAGVTQNQAAQQLGRPRSWYAMLETGRIVDFPHRLAQQLAQMLGTTIAAVEASHRCDVERASETAPTLTIRFTPAEAGALATHLASADRVGGLGEHRDLLIAVAERLRRAHEQSS